MIDEPHRWLQAINNRREYIEDQLKEGSPALAMSCADGILLFSMGIDHLKIFEIYDRIAFSAIGHPADIEKIRSLSIDITHFEGFQRSAEDVSLRRLVNFSISTALKNAFEQIYGSPFIVKLLFAELGREIGSDYMCSINYDGAFNRHADVSDQKHHTFTSVGGTKLAERRMKTYFEKEIGRADLPLGEAIQSAIACWQVGFSSPHNVDKFERDDLPSAAELKKSLKESFKTRHVEAALLKRKSTSNSTFQRVDEKIIQKAIKPYD
jgi:proteasome alpha subunit